MKEEYEEAKQLIKRLKELGLGDATIGDMVIEIAHLREKVAHLSVSSSAGLEGRMDTGDLVNDPLYIALDKLYERGWKISTKK